MRTFFWLRNAAAEGPLSDWFWLSERAYWKYFGDLRADFPSVDQVGKNVIFDIGGNNYRLIARVDFRRQGVFVLWVWTHAEYDRLTQEDIRAL